MSNPNCFKNPFSLSNQWGGNQLGDPFIMRFDGYSYLYCSSRHTEIKCWKSENLVEWDYIGSVCSLPEIDGAYAPEVCYFNGKFYMVTSPKGSGHYLLAADSPEGPFLLVSENFGLLIDGSLFVDDDGREYFLRAGHKGIVIHNMDSPILPALEGKTIPQSYLQHWTEGPMIIKRYGHYFLTYTGNHLLSRGYRVDYSVSETSASDGYVNLRNNTLLLEVGDEFHALGHSSTVLAPDMDSYYIAYHSFDFRTNQPFRSLNIDRLFFNGARMYTNATWWEQNSPTLPWFISRNGNGLTKSNTDNTQHPYLQTPTVSGAFTAELCINPSGKNINIAVGLDHIISISQDLSLSITDSGGNLLLSKAIPEAVCLSSHLTIRAAYAESGLFNIWLNNMWLGDCKINFTEGSIGIYSEAGAIPSFIGVSSIAYGSQDNNADKSIPGRFDAVHYKSGSNINIEEFFERGMVIHGVTCVKATTLSYPINTKASGKYLLFARARSGKNVSFLANGEPCELELGTTADSDGFAITKCGVLSLPAGKGVITLSDFSNEVLLDYIYLTEYHEQSSSPIIKNGDVIHSGLQILGHKRTASMIHKYYGFTCAENHGTAFFDETGWTDYTIKAVAHIAPKLEGSLSIFIRATKESWHNAQVGASLVGYRVKLDREGVHLFRCNYGESEAAFTSTNWRGEPERLVHIEISIRSATITINTDHNQTLTYTDPEQFCHGKAGIESCSEGYGFVSLDILANSTI